MTWRLERGKGVEIGELWRCIAVRRRRGGFELEGAVAVIGRWIGVLVRRSWWRFGQPWMGSSVGEGSWACGSGTNCHRESGEELRRKFGGAVRELITL